MVLMMNVTHIVVKFVEGNLHRKLTLSHTCEFTLEIDPSSVNSVQNHLVRRVTWMNTEEHIQVRNPTFVIFADLATQEKENYFFMSGAFILMRDHFNVHIVPRIFKEEISLESMKEFTRTQDHTVVNFVAKRSPQETK